MCSARIGVLTVIDPVNVGAVDPRAAYTAASAVRSSLIWTGLTSMIWDGSGTSVHGKVPSVWAVRRASIRARNSTTCTARIGVDPVVSVESVNVCVASAKVTDTVAAGESTVPVLFETLTQYFASPSSGGVT